MISFNQIPNNIRAPLNYTEVVNQNNSLGSQNNRILVLGQCLSSGTVGANVPTLISSYGQGVKAFGQGSILANMLQILFQNNSFTEVWVCASADAGGGTAATGTISVTGTATASGTIALYLGGVLVPVAIASGDTAAQTAAAIVAAISANLDLPITATVDGTNAYTADIAFRHKGTVGNYYDMRANYAGEVLPAGITLTFVQLASGATDPTLSSTFAALPADKIFNFIIHPYQGSTPVSAIEAQMLSQWNPLTKTYGQAIGAIGGSLSTLSTYGEARNSPYSTFIDGRNGSPSPSYLWAAGCGAVAAFSLGNDPARPLTTLPVLGLLPEVPQNRRSLSNRNTLLYDGIATTTTANDGTILLDRIITTYQENAFGVPDASYLDITTPATLSYLIQDLNAQITTKFGRMKLAMDGTKFGAGQAIVTPKIVAGEIIAQATKWVSAGLIQDLANFIATLVVEINANDSTRLDCLMQPTLVGGLYTVATQIAFGL